jgi:hypothetical protein
MKTLGPRFPGWIVLTLLLAALLPACQEAKRPPNVRVVTLSGGPYERGLQHGQALSAHIRSLYTKLLTASIIPFLNREQLNIAPVLPIYGQPEYLDGQFAYRMLLESGRNLYDNYLPEEIKQELQGIADGAGMELDEVIILNTFVDTMLAFRAIVMFIQGIQDPYLTEVAFIDGPASDGADNDGDGEVDEAAEGVLAPYSPFEHAALVEVPSDARIRITLEDINLPGLSCLDPRNAEPLGALELERRCVQDDCLLPGCDTADTVGVDCLNEKALDCIAPRIAAACMVEDCIELTDPGCVDPDALRLVLDGQVFTRADAALEMELLAPAGDLPPAVDPDCYGPLQVTFTPPEGLPPAAEVTLVVQAGDQSPIYSPAPLHARYMRNARIVFTTAGYAARTGRGTTPDEVPNRGIWDPTARPPAIAFAASGRATRTRQPLLAHHFALLDSDMVHEHSAVFVHLPDEGHAHVLLSWAGLAWGFAGMNEQGLALAVNYSDSLDNPLVGGVLDVMFEPENLAELLQNPDLVGLSRVLADTRLQATGLPVGIAGRELLLHESTTDGALARLYDHGRTYGWNFLLADAAGALLAVETDGASQDPEAGTAGAPVQEDGFAFYGPDPNDPANLDPLGRPWASVGGHDLRTACHFEKNADDMPALDLLGPFSPEDQRHWSTYYFRSLRAFYVLGEQIEQRLGSIDVPGAVAILRTPDLVDSRDSMMAAVFEPAAGIVHWAMGGVPASDQDFVPLDLGAWVERGGAP